MVIFSSIPAVDILCVSVAASVLGVFFLNLVRNRVQEPSSPLFVDMADRAEYLFDGETLLDATPTARAMLQSGADRSATQWARLMSVLTGRFPDLPKRLASLADEGSFILTTEGDVDAPLLVEVELRGGLTRISLADPEAGNGERAERMIADRALREEISHLRRTVANAPLPIWRESRTGDVVWANSGYLDLAVNSLGPTEDLTWPLPRIFECNAGAPAQSRRQKLDASIAGGMIDKWFDLTGLDTEGERLMFAVPADAAVQAERSLRAFMQTLTKTFAHLATGLAIFDQTRRLVLFNPALIDLTGLPPDMLSTRPSLLAFFDALRERSMIPEPRDYRSWRSQITDIEEAASSGLYQEVWSLPAGQTYRVTGRPHPNGALALMVEDISTEMSQTRRYQADLELGQAVIDAMDEAIAVFASSGLMVMSNAAYSNLWGHDPAGSLASDGGIAAISTHWRDGSAPSALWDRAEDFVALIGARDPWSDATFLVDGRLLRCRFAPLAGGATLAGFQVTQPATSETLALVSSRKSA